MKDQNAGDILEKMKPFLDWFNDELQKDYCWWLDQRKDKRMHVIPLIKNPRLEIARIASGLAKKRGRRIDPDTEPEMFIAQSALEKTRAIIE